MTRSRGQAPLRERELAEVRTGPRRGLGLPSGGVERQAHRVYGRLRAAEQLARVRNSRVRRDARLQRRHAVEGAEGGLVPAKLEQGVADDSVVHCRVRRKPLGSAAEHERPVKVVASQRE
jgi:hypothetical protein